MSRFAESAARIFEAAESASQSGHRLSEMTVLISARGGIRMIHESDWPLESLRMHHGAEMAFRVSERESRVSVEGRSGRQTCVLRGEKPDRFAREFLRVMESNSAGTVAGALERPQTGTEACSPRSRWLPA